MINTSATDWIIEAWGLILL